MSIITPFTKVKELNSNNNYNTKNIRFTTYHAFIFLLYHVIN